MMLTRPKPPSQPRGGGPLSTRGGTIFVAALLSLVAAVALLLFLRDYRNDLTSDDGVRVVVLKSLVPHGTSGEAIAENGVYRMTRVKKSELADGAITDPNQLEGKVATKDLYPGHQLTQSEFKAAEGTIGRRLADFDRAMSVPVDKAHGMTGRIEAGDRVDVLVSSDPGAGFGTVVKVAARNVLVLKVPDVADTGSSSRKEQTTIRVPDSAVPLIAAGADGGEVWLVLRPSVGARNSNQATARDLLKALEQRDAPTPAEAP
jgi:Flp pilus assembly protein CpaB